MGIIKLSVETIDSSAMRGSWLKGARGRIVALAFVIYFVILPFVFIILPTYLPRRMALQQASWRVLEAIAVSEMILVAMIYYLLRRHGRSWADLGWNKPSEAATIMAGVALALGMALSAVAIITPVRVYGFEFNHFKLLGLGVSLSIAVMEEIIFRGFLMTELDSLRVSAKHQIWISGLAYGLFRSLAVWQLLPATIAAGIVWASLYQWGRRSLMPPLYSHMLLNTIIEPWAVLNLVHQFTRYHT